MTDVTRILDAIQTGDPQAAEQLMPLVYDELRRAAAEQLAGEKPGQTLNATALVHEAYLRLVGPANAGGFANRRHFFAAAAEAMRRILIDRARRLRRPKHGDRLRRVDMEEALAVAEAPLNDILEIDEVLTRFAAVDAAKAQLVKLRFFAGLTMPEAAQALGVSLATAERWWSYARIWLYAELTDSAMPQKNSAP
jgi:RNA polymerase sigma factor (TIGR02999 family)